LERPIGQVRGTRDWLPDDYARLGELERLLLDCFARVGYRPMRTPVLEFVELHERKSGAGIVAKLYELANGTSGRLCLRPELTASIVRAYTEAAESPSLPWRVSMSGPVFRYEKDPQVGHYREFQQVGVEMLGASGPEADAEVLALAEGALREVGLADATLRLGHVGLILEMLRRSGLPTPAQSALVEMLSEAAAEGRGVRALETGLEQITHWLQSAADGEAPPTVEGEGAEGGAGVDRLFRTLVPDVAGRRSGHEILARLRRKWELGNSLYGVLERLRGQIHELAGLRGPIDPVLGRLEAEFRTLAPESVDALNGLARALGEYGVDRNRVELDLGFGRGIGFYSQLVFELVAPTPQGPVEVCGGGRYDGLARVLGSGRDDRGIGFAFGLERVYHALEARAEGRRR
jgi:histidyl-tRNA synthetase